jgi:hypothetical protein
VLRTVPLAGRNPFGAINATPDGVLWLAAPGNFDQATETDAGIERFDTKSETTALAMTERQLGGSALEVAVDATASCAAVIVADPTTKNRTRAIVVTLATRAVSELIGWTDGFDLRALSFGSTGSSKKLVVGDRRLTESRPTDKTPGVRGYPLHVFRPLQNGCTFVAEPDVLLPTPPVAVRTM